MNEVTVILKDDERTYKQKFLCYEQITLYNDFNVDPILQGYIEESKKNFLGEPDEVTLKISVELE